VQWATSAATTAPLPCTEQSEDDRAADAIGVDKNRVFGSDDGRRTIMLTHAPVTTMTITSSAGSSTSTVSGGLLGDLDSFKQTLAAPIEAGQDPKVNILVYL
jgi:hypothetical protein